MSELRQHQDLDALLAHRLVRAEAIDRHLTSAAGLREAATALTHLAERASCRNVVAASPRAELVVAAAAMLDDGFVLVDLDSIGGGQVDKVLVVESVAVTGMYIRQRVREVRDAGVAWVAVSVLYDLSDADRMVDDVEVDDWFVAA